MTEPKQSTLEEIIESERTLMLTAEQRYGKYYIHARGCSVFLSRCITSFEHDRLMFARFFSLMKKHHMLALLSFCRLHRVQGMMNLRQVLEAGVAAAFALVQPDVKHFADIDDQGILDPSQDLARKRYTWLDQHYPDKSATIKKKKDLINEQSAHANVVNSEAIFKINAAGDATHQPFFDIEDEYRVKGDLLLMSGIALELADLLYGVNMDLKVIEFVSDFTAYVRHAAKENETLLAEMKSTDRFKRAIEKYGDPSART